MTNFIINTNSLSELYFYRPYEGICRKRQYPGGAWSFHHSVLAAGTEHFGVYSAQDGTVHLICTDIKNRLVYITRKNDIQKKHVLSVLPQEISVLGILIYPHGERLNFLYSAKIREKLFLVHCILGDHAKPTVIAEIESPYFFIKKQRVYFTGVSGTFGYVPLNDEKPSVFFPLYDNAHFGSVFSLADTERVIFTRNSRLFIDGKEILYDPNIKIPFFSELGEHACIMWQSGSFIRCIALTENGAFSSPMRFLTGENPHEIFTLQTKDGYHCCYGHFTSGSIKLFGLKEILA